MRKDFVIAQLGSVSKVAELLKIKPQAVSQWGEVVPELRAYKLRELRPDLFGPLATTNKIAA